MGFIIVRDLHLVGYVIWTPGNRLPNIVLFDGVEIINRKHD